MSQDSILEESGAVVEFSKGGCVRDTLMCEPISKFEEAVFFSSTDIWGGGEGD